MQRIRHRTQRSHYLCRFCIHTYYTAIHTKRDATKNHIFCVSFLSYLIVKMVSRHPHFLEENEKRNHHSQDNQCPVYSSPVHACTQQSALIKHVIAQFLFFVVHLTIYTKRCIDSYFQCNIRLVYQYDKIFSKICSIHSRVSTPWLRKNCANFTVHCRAPSVSISRNW